MEKTKVSFDRGLNKDDVAHTYNGCYSAVRKKEILPFTTTWIDLENIMLNEINQSEKAKSHMISLLCGIQNCNS